MPISPDLLTWLLDPREPSLRWRTLTGLLALPAAHPLAQETSAAIPASPPANAIFSRMQPEGTWLERNPRSGAWVGAGTEYGNHTTTHFMLAYLAELGLDRQDARVEQAAERYLGLLRPDGDWLGHFSCHYAYNLRTLLLLGYRGDPRLEPTLALLERSARADGGYLCDMHEPPPTSRRTVCSCIRGAVKALAAWSELGPDHWGSPACQRLCAYFLERGGIFRRRQRQAFVNQDVQQTIFPFSWRSGLVEILFHLSRLGHGSDPRLEHAWQVLESKRDETGRYRLDWSPAHLPWKVGRRGQPNPWVTFYAIWAQVLAGRETLPAGWTGDTLPLPSPTHSSA